MCFEILTNNVKTDVTDPNVPLQTWRDLRLVSPISCHLSFKMSCSQFIHIKCMKWQKLKFGSPFLAQISIWSLFVKIMPIIFIFGHNLVPFSFYSPMGHEKVQIACYLESQLGETNSTKKGKYQSTFGQQINTTWKSYKDWNSFLGSLEQPPESGFSSPHNF